MPRTPLTRVSAQGALARDLTPGRVIVRAGFEVTTGAEMQRFMRDFQGRFIKGLPSRIYDAHDDIGWIAARHMGDVLKEKMRAKKPQRGRDRNILRRTLEGARVPIKPHRVLPAGRGVVLNAETMDKAVPYWRNVNDGWIGRETQGHLFRTRGGTLVRPIQAAGAVFGRLGLGGDPRMPRVGVDTEFRTNFEGYRFFEEGTGRAKKELTRLGAAVYTRNMEFPVEMLRAMEFFGAGGRVRDAFDHVNDPRLRQ